MAGYECCRHCESTETCGQYENRHPIPCPWPGCQPQSPAAADSDDDTTSRSGTNGGAAIGTNWQV